MRSNEEIYDKDGNLIGYKVFGSGGRHKVVYPKYLQDNIRRRKGFRR